MFKTPLLLALFAATAFGQIPDKSVVGSATVYVSDLSVPVPYGDAQSMTVVSACTAEQTTKMTFVVDYVTSVDGALVAHGPLYTVTQSTIAKTSLGYCASVFVPFQRKTISSLSVESSNTFGVSNAAPALASSSPMARATPQK